MTFDLKYATEYISNLNLSTPRRTVAVFGGTNGLGEGIVLKLGALGSKIILLGRDQVNAGKIKDEVKSLKPRGDVAEITFVQCDLRTIHGMKDAVQKLSKEAGPKGLDSLFLCQHGMISGEIKLTEDGHEQGYAVQSLSRFIITHQVASLGLLKPGGTVVFVAVGSMDLKDMSVDDLSLIERSKTRGKRGLFWVQTLRNHSVLDSIIIEFNKRFPIYQFHTVQPTIIITPTYPWDQILFPFGWFAWILSFFIGSTRETFAPLPIYVALGDQADRERMLGDHRMWSQPVKGLKFEPGSWASKESNRVALWDKLSESL